MRTLLENLREDEQAESLRGVQCGGRFLVNDIGQAIAEIERLQAMVVAADREIKRSRADADRLRAETERLWLR
jgi:hypothetical protein